MGYNNFGNGCIHQCWMESGNVFFTDTCGVTHSYSVTVEDQVSKQTNVFHSEEVIFYLKGNDRVYIGRRDGILSVYREKDMLLIGVQHWDVPLPPKLETAGYRRGATVLFPIYINRDDNRSVYCTYRNAESCLLKPHEGNFLVDSYVLDALSITLHHHNEFDIFDEGGVRLETNQWNIQEKLWRRDCPCFL